MRKHYDVLMESMGTCQNAWKPAMFIRTAW